MTTETTEVIRARINSSAMEALKADAAELGDKPGTLVRRLLEKRYSSSPTAEGNSASREGKTPTPAEAPEVSVWTASPLPKD